MNFQKQKGVALVVGLVMLLLLTIMGISSMSNTTQELKIACNFQNHNDAFQASMSCVDTAIAQSNRGNLIPNQVTTVNCAIPGSTTAVISTIEYLGCQVVQGSSLKSGAAYELIFDIATRGTAQGCSGQAVSNIVQAIGVRTALDSCEQL